jgi:hypothetical protein
VKGTSLSSYPVIELSTYNLLGSMYRDYSQELYQAIYLGMWGGRLLGDWEGDRDKGDRGETGREIAENGSLPTSLNLPSPL